MGDQLALLTATELADGIRRRHFSAVEGDILLGTVQQDRDSRTARVDLGKVIGKQGRTARSIRTLLGAAGMKLNRRFTLEILE